MDYLSALPLELWMEIICLSSPFINVPPDPWKYLNFQYDRIQARQAQSQRLSVVCSCRLFYQLGEPLLYKEVVLFMKRKAQSLRIAAKSKKFRTRTYAELTESLFLYAGGVEALEAEEPINAIFPNLVTMVAYGASNHLFWMWDVRSGARSLTHTTFYPIVSGQAKHETYDLKRVSTGHLILNSRSPGILPQLCALTIGQRSITNLGDKPFELPSLKHLFIELSCWRIFRDPARTFIAKHGSKLVELGFMHRNSLSFPNGLFETCPNLKVLRFDAGSFSPIGPLHHDLGIPHHSLSKLVLSMNSAYSMDYIKKHSKWFTLDRFPNLSRVNLSLGFQKNGDLLQSLISLMFPDVEVSIVD